jgi:predicted ATP-dependent protease
VIPVENLNEVLTHALVSGKKKEGLMNKLAKLVELGPGSASGMPIA